MIIVVRIIGEIGQFRSSLYGDSLAGFLLPTMSTSLAESELYICQRALVQSFQSRKQVGGPCRKVDRDRTRVEALQRL